MLIVTSSFFVRLPGAFARLSIARWAPAGHRDLPAIRALAPGNWFKTVDEAEYGKLYRAQLADLDACGIVSQIEDVAAGAPAALLCWERPRDGRFCHRAYVSAWLQDQLGLEVFEFGMEDAGCGHQHPKLPSRRNSPPAQGELF